MVAIGNFQCPMEYDFAVEFVLASLRQHMLATVVGGMGAWD
jgi:hypothetical protein